MSRQSRRLAPPRAWLRPRPRRPQALGRLAARTRGRKRAGVHPLNFAPHWGVGGRAAACNTGVVVVGFKQTTPATSAPDGRPKRMHRKCPWHGPAQTVVEHCAEAGTTAARSVDTPCDVQDRCASLARDPGAQTQLEKRVYHHHLKAGAFSKSLKDMPVAQQTTLGLILTGCLVNQLLPGGPAHLAGLRKGDTILEVPHQCISLPRSQRSIRCNVSDLPCH